MLRNMIKTGKEIHLKKRPSVYAKLGNCEIAKVEIPELKEEGEFLVQNIWMSVDPFSKNYMIKGKIEQCHHLN